MPLSHSRTSTTYLVNQFFTHSHSRKVTIFPSQCYVIQELSFAHKNSVVLQQTFQVRCSNSYLESQTLGFNRSWAWASEICGV